MPVSVETLSQRAARHNQTVGISPSQRSKGNPYVIDQDLSPVLIIDDDSPKRSHDRNGHYSNKGGHWKRGKHHQRMRKLREDRHQVEAMRNGRRERHHGRQAVQSRPNGRH